MPSIYITDTLKFEYDDWGDQSFLDGMDLRANYGKSSTSSSSASRHSPTLPLGPRGRPIAGSKRVAKYQAEQSYLKNFLEEGSTGQLLQSITAHPALSTRSFEELRVECYAQSFIAQGKPPTSVNVVTTPAAVIPPLFNAYHDDTPDILPTEITMAD